LVGLSKDQIPKVKVVLKKLHLLFPIVFIVYLLFQGFSIERTALLGILSTIVVSMILKETRINFAKFITALTSGARTALGVAAATATAGILSVLLLRQVLDLKWVIV